MGGGGLGTLWRGRSGKVVVGGSMGNGVLAMAYLRAAASLVFSLRDVGARVLSFPSTRVAYLPCRVYIYLS